MSSSYPNSAIFETLYFGKNVTLDGHKKESNQIPPGTVGWRKNVGTDRWMAGEEKVRTYLGMDGHIHRKYQ